jgi:hypothetical protein
VSKGKKLFCWVAFGREVERKERKKKEVEVESIHP